MLLEVIAVAVVFSVTLAGITLLLDWMDAGQCDAESARRRERRDGGA